MRWKNDLSAGTKAMLVLTGIVLVACILFLARIFSKAPDISEAYALFPAGEIAADEPDEPLEATPAPTPVQKKSTPVPEKESPVLRMTLAAAGTVYAPKSIQESVEERGGHYDFSNVFKGLGDTLSRADLSIVTLETTVAGKEEGYDNYNAPPQILDALRDAGVDLVALATERALDKGYKGLDITRSELTSRGMACAGIREDGQNAATMLNVGGIQVAVLAYSYGLSDTGKTKTQNDARGVLAMLETERMTRDITRARAEGAQVVIVLPHWGTKNMQEIPQNVRTMAKALARAGADVILGTHPNVVQETERLRVTRADGLEYETVVCYSLGSLLTDARTEQNTAGMAAFLPIEYNQQTRHVTLGELEVMPLYIARNRENGRSVYRVVNAEDEEIRLDESERAAAQRACEIVREAVQ